MAFIETEQSGEVFVIRLNRPERLNALGVEMDQQLRAALQDFATNSAEVAILTGTGRGFCAGEDLKETAVRGVPAGDAVDAVHAGDLYGMLEIEKPFIAAVNGFAMGGGFMLVANSDLRVSVSDAVFEVSEAKRWLLGGVSHGHSAGLPMAVTAEMAFGLRFDAERLHQLGFINRLVPTVGDLMGTARAMADHLLSLPPAARVNTTRMLRAMRPRLDGRLAAFADALHQHGAASDLVESRRAFAEKRPPVYRGWDDPVDRARGPVLEGG